MFANREGQRVPQVTFRIAPPTSGKASPRRHFQGPDGGGIFLPGRSRRRARPCTCRAITSWRRRSTPMEWTRSSASRSMIIRHERVAAEQEQATYNAAGRNGEFTQKMGML